MKSIKYFYALGNGAGQAKSISDEFKAATGSTAYAQLILYVDAYAHP